MGTEPLGPRTFKDGWGRQGHLQVCQERGGRDSRGLRKEEGSTDSSTWGPVGESWQRGPVPLG